MFLRARKKEEIEIRKKRNSSIIRFIILGKEFKRYLNARNSI